jgi:hypothetical protein
MISKEDMHHQTVVKIPARLPTMKSFERPWRRGQTMPLTDQYDDKQIL